MKRYVHFASRLTGWNAIKSRCEQLGYEMTDAQYKECTAKIKALADVKNIALEDTDVIIQTYYHNVHSKQEKPLLDGLSKEEMKVVEQATAAEVSI